MTGRMRVIVGLAKGELGHMVPGFDFRADGYEERTGPGAAGREINRTIGLQLARRRPPTPAIIGNASCGLTSMVSH